MASPAPAESTRTWPRLRWFWSDARALPFRAGLCLLAATAAARIAGALALPLPLCQWRRWTGLPCPACGCTRSLLAWSHGEWLGALRWNPLFFLLCATLLFWVGLRGVAAAAKPPGVLRSRLLELEGRLARLCSWKAFGLLAFLNWLYLLLNLPN
jgi:hypothetical protein